MKNGKSLMVRRLWQVRSLAIMAMVCVVVGAAIACAAENHVKESPSSGVQAPLRTQPVSVPSVRLRGVNYDKPNEEDLRILAQEWHANQVRWILVPMLGEKAKNLDSYEECLEKGLQDFDKGLAICEKYGLKVLLDLHTGPGGTEQIGNRKSHLLFADRKNEDKFIEVWTRIAKRYKGRPSLYGFDLLNEPSDVAEPKPGVLSWKELATRAAQAIRSVDPEKKIIFEPGVGWFKQLTPLDVEGVVYSFHFYAPHTFTHQGIKARKVLPTPYPGVFDRVRWDNKQMRKSVAAVVEFQNKYKVPIYVGEFSAVRWAPGAADYLRDAIDMFEEYGWDWSYHCYRGAYPWNVELGPDPDSTKISPTPTDRKQVLLKGLALNIPAKP